MIAALLPWSSSCAAARRKLVPTGVSSLRKSEREERLTVRQGKKYYSHATGTGTAGTCCDLTTTTTANNVSGTATTGNYFYYC